MTVYTVEQANPAKSSASHLNSGFAKSQAQLAGFGGECSQSPSFLWPAKNGSWHFLLSALHSRVLATSYCNSTIEPLLVPLDTVPLSF